MLKTGVLQENAACCPAGSCTTPTCLGPGYTTMQYRPAPAPRPSNIQHDHYASLRRAGYSPAGRPGPGADSCCAPLLSPACPQLSALSSEVSSSDLNHSLTTSDTSDASSERDRESEV